MNILGKRIDKATIDKVTELLETPEGEKLKASIARLDKREVLKAIEKINVSELDFDEFVRSIQRLDKNDLKKIDYSQFRR